MALSAAENAAVTWKTFNDESAAGLLSLPPALSQAIQGWGMALSQVIRSIETSALSAYHYLLKNGFIWSCRFIMVMLQHFFQSTYSRETCQIDIV